MGPKSDAMDVESLQKGGARRGRWLDCCLLLSVIFLFAALGALAAAGVLVARDLQSRLNKNMNFANLEATLSVLKNHTMQWTAVSFPAGKFVGSNYEFDSQQHSLQVKQSGSYFMYLELNVRCMSRCEPGLFKIQVSDKLSCEVHLPHHNSSKLLTRKCWTVSMLTADTHLLSQMTLPNGTLPNWKLERSGSRFGMFLVN